MISRWFDSWALNMRKCKRDPQRKNEEEACFIESEYLGVGVCVCVWVWVYLERERESE